MTLRLSLPLMLSRTGPVLLTLTDILTHTQHVQ